MKSVNLNKKLKVTVVIPARNEEANIVNMVNILIKHIGKDIVKIIIVNDNSTDSSKDILNRLVSKNKKVVAIHRNKLPGVGNSIRRGYREVSSSSDYILSLDCDFTKNIGDIRRMLTKAEKTDADLVLGSRYMKGGRLIGYPLIKKIANRSFHLLARSIFGFQYVDVTNNFKLMKFSVIKSIRPLLKSNGFSINAETGLYPIILSYKVCESPVSWIGRDKDMGRSNFKVIQAGSGYLNVLLDVFKYKYLTGKMEYSIQGEKRHFDSLVKKTGETNFANLRPIAAIRFKRKVEDIIRMTKHIKKIKVLEVGCGTGILSNELLKAKKGIELVGIDLSGEAIKIAKKKNSDFTKAKFIVGNTLSMSFKDNSFDLVIGNSILHHIPLDKALTEIHRVLKPNGLIWFSEPNSLNPQIFLTKNVPFVKKILQDSPTETAFNRWDLKKILEKQGFCKVRVKPFDFFHPITPGFLINILTPFYLLLERTPLLKELSGSLEIIAKKD